jgi:hypothetical protein
MSEEEYNRLLKQFPDKLKNAIRWKKYFERLVQAGRRTGRSDIQIGDDIRKELKGQLDDRTIRAYLPESMKHMEKKKLSLIQTPDEDQDPHISQADSNNQQTGRVIKLPDIPPVIKEANIEGIVSASVSPIPVEHIKEFAGSYDPDYELILDCRKFKTELRMGTLNNSRLKLKVKDNEVIKIKEI